MMNAQKILLEIAAENKSAPGWASDQLAALGLEGSGFNQLAAFGLEGSGFNQLAALGLERSGFNQMLHIWPENWNVVRLFETLQSQWKIGPDCDRFVFTCIDYAPAVLMARPSA